MSKYIVQTRPNIERKKVDTITFLDSYSIPSGWTEDKYFDDFDEAKEYCKEKISEGVFLPSCIRIVKVACTFVADIKTIEN